MSGHPDLEAEQAYIDRAYACLEATRAAASRMTSMVEVGRGGTEQARFERDVIWDTMLQRLSQLQLGDASLIFGRIDGEDDATPYYIGRIAVSDENQDVVVVDWRAPDPGPFLRGPRPPADGPGPAPALRHPRSGAARRRGRALRRRRHLPGPR